MRLALTALLLAALIAAGCSGDDADPASPESGATTSSSAGRDTTPTVTAVAVDGLPDQYGVRYCEVLTVTVGDDGTTAEVWGTQGLNDCPQDKFDTIDPDAVAADMGVSVAVPNGPRFWVLDRIVANELAGSGETREFGGIEMRSIAQVDLGVGVPDRSPYTETSVERSTQFIFDEGREVYELTAPDGSIYVMQSYSVEIDPALSLDGLAGLGDGLERPDGWAFEARVLDEEMVVEDIDGIATVVQDELRNTYQLRDRG